MATEKRLIDADALIDRLKFKRNGSGQRNTYPGLESAIAQVKKAPTVDAVEVAHGRWVQGDMYDYGDVCSVCDWDSAREPCRFNYCPNCGAKMDGDTE